MPVNQLEAIGSKKTSQKLGEEQKKPTHKNQEIGLIIPATALNSTEDGAASTDVSSDSPRSLPPSPTGLTIDVDDPFSDSPVACLAVSLDNTDTESQGDDSSSTASASSTISNSKQQSKPLQSVQIKQTQGQQTAEIYQELPIIYAEQIPNGNELLDAGHINSALKPIEHNKISVAGAHVLQAWQFNYLLNQQGNSDIQDEADINEELAKLLRQACNQVMTLEGNSTLTIPLVTNLMENRNHHGTSSHWLLAKIEISNGQIQNITIWDPREQEPDFAEIPNLATGETERLPNENPAILASVKSFFANIATNINAATSVPERVVINYGNEQLAGDDKSCGDRIIRKALEEAGKKEVYLSGKDVKPEELRQYTENLLKSNFRQAQDIAEEAQEIEDAVNKNLAAKAEGDKEQGNDETLVQTTSTSSRQDSFNKSGLKSQRDALIRALESYIYQQAEIAPSGTVPSALHIEGTTTWVKLKEKIEPARELLAKQKEAGYKLNQKLAEKLASQLTNEIIANKDALKSLIGILVVLPDTKLTPEEKTQSKIKLWCNTQKTDASQESWLYEIEREPVNAQENLHKLLTESAEDELNDSEIKQLKDKYAGFKANAKDKNTAKKLDFNDEEKRKKQFSSDLLQIKAFKEINDNVGMAPELKETKLKELAKLYQQWLINQQRYEISNYRNGLFSASAANTNNPIGRAEIKEITSFDEFIEITPKLK